MRIDLNADVGELDAEIDARIMAAVTSVNIACGGHTGDDESMARVAGLAATAGIRIGAHPSYLDRAGFGRTTQDVDPVDLSAQLRDQILRLAGNSPAPISYVKPHGALYHRAAHDDSTAQALIAGLEQVGELAVMGQADALYLERARAAGLEVITEGFADRAYADDGRLIPRGEPGAVLVDEAAVMAQVTDLASGRVRTVTGRVIRVSAQSLCVHSDTPGAADLAHRIAGHLRACGFTVAAP